MESMKAADIKAFIERDWELLEQMKAKFWSESEERKTPAARIRMGEQLYRYARSVRPDWPSQDERDADLAVHTRVAEALRRAAPGFAKSREAAR